MSEDFIEIGEYIKSLSWRKRLRIFLAGFRARRRIYLIGYQAGYEDGRRAVKTSGGA